MSELVSVIIPTYRRPDVLERSLGSVLRQTYRPLELIVVDDGSGDNTQEVLADWADKAAGASVEYRYFEKENGGPGLARNYGLEHARGSLFAFLDDDDRWYPGKLETQIDTMRMNPEAGVSFTRYVHEGREDTPKPRERYLHDGWVFDTLCSGKTRVHMQTMMVRREAYERVGGFIDERNFEDTQWALRLALETQFVAVREPLTVICTVESSISREAGLEGDLRRDAAKLAILDRFAAKYGTHERFNADAFAVQRARIYDEHVKHLLWLGRVDEARAAWDRAIQVCGEQEMLVRLKRKLSRARVAGWFGLRLRKP